MSATSVLAPVSIELTGPRGSLSVRYAFDLESEVQRQMYDSLKRCEFFEPATTRLLMSVLRPGDTFIDVGGHVGYFTMLASVLVGDEGEVITFEPSPDNYRQLLEHVALNGFTNVLPLHLAAGNTDHVMPLHLNSDNDGGHALWNVGIHPDNHKSRATPRIYPTFVTRLDRVMRDRQTRPVRAIKLDVEGSEVQALQGAAETLATHQVPFVIAEVNRSGLEWMGNSEAELRSLMTGLGYDTWLINDDTQELVPLGGDTTVAGNFVFNLLFRRPGAVIG